MFTPNEGHEEEYENYLEEWGEWVRENVMLYLAEDNKVHLFDDAVLTCTGGFCTIDAPVDTYAAVFVVEVPSIGCSITIEAVGFTNREVETKAAFLVRVDPSLVEGEKIVDLGFSVEFRDAGRTCYESLNEHVAHRIAITIVDRNLLQQSKA